jgi:hypothetical protein
MLLQNDGSGRLIHLAFDLASPIAALAQLFFRVNAAEALIYVDNRRPSRMSRSPNPCASHA